MEEVAGEEGGLRMVAEEGLLKMAVEEYLTTEAAVVEEYLKTEGAVVEEHLVFHCRNHTFHLPTSWQFCLRKA